MTAIDAIAEHLRRPSSVPFAGAALFFSARYAALGRAEDADVALEWLGKGVAEAPATMGLHGGLTQVGWVAHCLEAVLNVDVTEVCRPVDTELLRLLEVPRWNAPYDLVHGLVGFGTYLASRLPLEHAAQGIRNVVRHLEDLSEPTRLGRRWLTPAAFGAPGLQLLSPEGWYDLGLAHGVAGIIGLLGIAYDAGIERSRALRLADSAVQWLLAHRVVEESGGLPSVVLRNGSRRYGKVAWCYGELGVSVALLGAANQFGRPDWAHAAVELGRIAAAKPFHLSRVKDAGLCHGAAGDAHLFARLYQATGDEEFRKSAEFYYSKALTLVEQRGMHAFWVQDNPYRPARWTDDGSLLEGSSGLGLSLLSGLFAIEPAWDGLLLASATGTRRAPGGGLVQAECAS